MKRRLMLALAAVAVLAMTIPASAHRYDRRDDGSYLRILAHGFNAVGIAVEYAITRPIHWLGSRDHLDIVLGHQPYLADDGTYFEWVHGDYEPSIAEARDMEGDVDRTMVVE